MVAMSVAEVTMPAPVIAVPWEMMQVGVMEIVNGILQIINVRSHWSAQSFHSIATPLCTVRRELGKQR